MTIITTQEHKVRSEQAFIVSVSENVAAGGTLNLHIHNPPGDDKRAVITSTRVVSPDGKAVIDIPYGFTVDSNGTERAISNRARGSPKSSNMTAYQDTSYSGATHTYTSYAGSGEGGSGNAVGGETEDVLGTLVSDNDFIISVTNPGSSARDMSITVTFYETSAEIST